MNHPSIFRVVLAVAAAMAASYQRGWAADDSGPPLPSAFTRLGGSGGGDETVQAKAEFTPARNGAPAVLCVTATIKPQWHIYSITQAPGGPVRTTINIDPSPKVKLNGKFQADPPPHKGTMPDAWKDLLIETHEGTVTWRAPIEIAPGTDPARLEITGQVTAQACSESSCMPPRNYAFVAHLGSGPKDAVPLTGNAQTSVSAPPSTAAPPIPSAPPIPPASSAAPPMPGGPPAPATPSSSPPVPAAAAAPAPATTHHGALPWRPYTSFSAFRSLLAPSFDPDVMSRNVIKQLAEGSLALELLYGFLGGILLNIMPCVLPVIGLKVLAFVEQSGHHRGRAFALNVWYSLGLLSVFMLLAVLAVSLNLGWGHLFTYAGFNIALAGVVFAMGLSFLGVWEIPIPGFAGSNKAQELAAQEGFAGAFFKGVLTTILATPCTGPFMATALAWAVNQPPANTFAVFAAVGLGMASPYLLIGAFPQLLSFLPKPGAWMDTFKQLMGFVLLGTVVYMLTFLEPHHVVPTIGLLVAVWFACWWIARVPYTAEGLIRLRVWAEGALVIAVAWLFMFPGLKGFLPESIAPGGLASVMQERQQDELDRGIAMYLEEQPAGTAPAVAETAFAPALDPPSSSASPRTVLVDFTANWCATCKTLEKVVLGTTDVRNAVRQNGVVMVHADWTHGEPEISKFMEYLGAKEVPVIAIFPPDRPNEPIVFRDGYSKRQILNALAEARLSKLK